MLDSSLINCTVAGRGNPNSVTVWVPGVPATGGTNVHLYISDIVDAFDRKSSETGYRGITDPDMPIRVDSIYCMPHRRFGDPATSQDETRVFPGDLHTIRPDHDNLAIIAHRAIKAEGFPLPDNRQIAVASQFKVYQHRPGVLITVAPVLSEDDLAPIDVNAALIQHGLVPFRFPSVPSVLDVAQPWVEFFVPGEIAYGKPSSLDTESYRVHILEAFSDAADECGFPRVLPPNCTVHISMLYCYSNRAKAGQLKVSEPDIEKLPKIFNDGLKDDGKPLPDDAMIATAWQGKMYHRHVNGVLVHIHLIRTEADLYPPDIDKWIERHRERLGLNRMKFPHHQPQLLAAPT